MRENKLSHEKDDRHDEKMDEKFGKIEHIGDHLNDATRFTPEQCLRNCLENDIGKREAFKNGKKLIIICLDDSSDDYLINFNQAGMKASEILSLLTVIKKHVLRMMGF